MGRGRGPVALAPNVNGLWPYAHTQWTRKPSIGIFYHIVLLFSCSSNVLLFWGVHTTRESTNGHEQISYKRSNNFSKTR
jgi:hypothetical protein